MYYNNNYYFSRPDYGYAYGNPYGLNFSRYYPRVVAYNFNIHDAFPKEHREEMIQDSKSPFIKDAASGLIYGTENPRQPFMNPRGERAVIAAAASDPRQRYSYGQIYRDESDPIKADIDNVQAAIAAANALRHKGPKGRKQARVLTRSARPAMDRINTGMVEMLKRDVEKYGY